MLQSVLDYSKQWPRAFSTAGIGMFFLAAIHNLIVEAGQEGFLLTSLSFQTENLAMDQIVSVLNLVVFAYVSGVVLIVAGSIIQSTLTGIDLGLDREMLVFGTSNPLVIQRYQRVSFQVEVIGGLLAAVLLSFLFSIFVVATEDDAARLTIAEIMGAVLMFSALAVVSWISVKPLKEIDQVLSRPSGQSTG